MQSKSHKKAVNTRFSSLTLHNGLLRIRRSHQSDLSEHLPTLCTGSMVRKESQAVLQRHELYICR